MLSHTSNGIFFALLFGFASIFSGKESKELSYLDKPTKLVSVRKDGNTFDLSYTNRTEVFYAKSLTLFSKSSLDQIFYVQTAHDLDFASSINNKAIESFLSIRNKGRWGNATSIARTTVSSVKLGDIVAGAHRHALPRQIVWIREGWVDLCLNKTFNIQLPVEQHFRFGMFSFQLGRGISLGSAYAVSPGILGFFTDAAIDQYAYGALFNGDIVNNCKNRLSYDIYTAILENQSDKVINNLTQVLAQEIGKADRPWRGFGKINFIVASRLNWILKPGPGLGNIKLEPYSLINITPEQEIEFLADAKSKLATVGLACDYEGDRNEWGWEVAANFGHQTVRHWDRNHIVGLNNSTTAAYTSYYTDVYTDSTLTTQAIASSANKAIVKASVQSESLNGKEIGTSGLYNSDTRFRGGYENHYRGMMFVADWARWVYKNDLRLALAFAYATGDHNPNVDLDDVNSSVRDKNYDGFIGLQEIYSGKRIKSTLVLSSNAIPRPMSAPHNPHIPKKHQFASVVSGFTNLVYFGVGAEYSPKNWCARFSFKPNVIAYWQQKATNKHDAVTGQTKLEDASKFLGVEVNQFTNITLTDNLTAFIIGGIFIPGAHFHDIKGKPLSFEQKLASDAHDATGTTSESYPLLGTKHAVMLNWGLEYKF